MYVCVKIIKHQNILQLDNNALNILDIHDI